MEANVNDLYEYQLQTAKEYVDLAKFFIHRNDFTAYTKIVATAKSLFPENSLVDRLFRGIALESPKVKVFGIGLSRTGTHSLSHALNELGLNSAHWLKSDGSGKIIDWDDIYFCDASSDTPISFIFESLYYTYPDAKFIYTTRDVLPWSASMLRHFKWAEGFDGFKRFVNDTEADEGKLAKSPYWKIIHKNLYANCDSWEDAYFNFDTRVRGFFSDKTRNFLEIDITKGGDKEKWDLLCEFLGYKNGCPLVKPFPRKNIKNSSLDSSCKPKWLEEALCVGGNLGDIFSLRKKALKGKFCIKESGAKEEVVTLPLPNEGGRHYIFRDAKKKRMSADVLCIKDGYISVDFTLPYRYRYYFFDSSGNYIPELSSGDSPFFYDPVKFNKSVNFIEDKFTKFNVCHYLCDKLRRVKEIGVDAPVLDFSEGEYPRQIKELLGLSSIDIKEFADGENRLTARFNEIFVSSTSAYSFIHPGNIADQYLFELRDAILESVKPVKYSKKEKIFISRSDASTRKILNSDSIEEALSDKGYRTVQLGKLTFEQQVELFFNADVVVGVHGAGLTNVMFSQPGVKVVEILPPLCATPAFWIISNIFGHSYNSYIAQDIDIPEPCYSSWEHNAAKYNGRNVIVDKVWVEKNL